MMVCGASRAEREADETFHDLECEVGAGGALERKSGVDNFGDDHVLEAWPTPDGVESLIPSLRSSPKLRPQRAASLTTTCCQQGTRRTWMRHLTASAAPATRPPPSRAATLRNSVLRTLRKQVRWHGRCCRKIPRR